MSLHYWFKFILVALLSVSNFVFAEEAQPATVKIEINGLEEISGDLYLAVYDSSDAWLGDGVVLSQKIVIDEARNGDLVVAEFEVAQGNYAFTIFYDENTNGDLDTNFIGIPKEPIALSNNARAKFGPPKFDDAVFEVGSAPVLQRIDMTEI